MADLVRAHPLPLRPETHSVGRGARRRGAVTCLKAWGTGHPGGIANRMRARPGAGWCAHAACKRLVSGGWPSPAASADSGKPSTSSSSSPGAVPWRAVVCAQIARVHRLRQPGLPARHRGGQLPSISHSPSPCHPPQENVSEAFPFFPCKTILHASCCRALLMAIALPAQDDGLQT